MRARTPRTSAEAALEHARWVNQARSRGREPERMGRFGALVIDGPLPPDHPLADSPAEARAKRVQAERRRRGLL